VETIRPATRRNATGPLRRLLLTAEAPRPWPGRRVQLYLAPIALLALIGLGFVAGEYLADNRVLPGIVIWILGIGSVLPVGLCVRWLDTIPA